MVFTAPSWAPNLPKIPDVSLCEFMFDEQYGRASMKTSLPPYVCSISGRSISALEQKDRVELLARGLAFELGWPVNGISELQKVVAIFSLNTIDVPTATWAVHRINGVCAPVNSAFNEIELAHQLQASTAKAIFTVLPLLETAKTAAALCGISDKRIFLCSMPGEESVLTDITTFSQLLEIGRQAPRLEALQWSSGQSKRQTAFLSHSSGTSGPPKLAMISHHNIIANTIQLTLFEQKGRGGPKIREVVLGVLPHSHIYGVVVISHLSTYRGDSVIILPKFDMQQVLESVSRYRINTLNIVPPIIVAISKNPGLLEQYDMGSVRTVVSGGAPLSKETVELLNQHYPHWVLRSAYGLTEIGAVITHTSAHDPWSGSSGSVVSGIKVKLLLENGQEVTDYDQPGEVCAKGPGVILGYFGDQKATDETFKEESDGRWLITGDIACFRKAPSGNEHIFIVDRVKEVIKVKGQQVAPSELEACLLTHPSVAECAVIGVPDERAGERPKAFVQKSPAILGMKSDEALADELDQFVRSQKSRYKWLGGGIEFVDSIPKSPSGKILRRLLRDQEKRSRERKREKL